MNATQHSSSTVLVFGSQALSSNHESLSNIPSSIASSSALSWATKAVSELVEDFAAAKKELPQLEETRGEEHLRRFSDALRTGTSDTIDISADLPNIIQSPLCVLSHLEAYYRNIGQSKDAIHVTDTAGFCTGLLSAVAVALSHDLDDLERHGATCLRLAMLIGAIVDSYDAANGESTSFSAAWKDAECLQTLESVIQSNREAYISVRYDENRATVTLPVKDLSSTQKELNSCGIITTAIRLSGRFHSKCHQHSLSNLAAFCEKNSRFRLPDASELNIPCWSDSLESRMPLDSGGLSTSILQSMLVKQSNWWRTFKALSSSDTEAKTIAILGAGRCTPPSLLQSTSNRFHLEYLGLQPAKSGTTPPPSRLDNDVAIIGLSCKVAGAEDANEFFDILCQGKSQHSEVPSSRFSFDTPFRANDTEKKWYGNFVKDHDAFDHKFFKKTPREAAAMDPQQRLLMEVAYQAVAQSGYFLDETPNTNIGCYIGACAVDYECNVACHKPNAFSSTGNLRGFIAGKISHYFGWTGPGLTVDTACSGAAVSVHQACRAILGGECDAALAGGVNMITQPLAYQNLAAASFLSPSGQCKPFCAKADGYCRGESVAAVFLKKRSQAIADGDQIFGIISGTAVQQNENCTAIFVPNAPSLSGLFRKVLSQSQLDPLQISYVEAHGTGTPVGDPAEYDSISQVFVSNKRSKPLQLGSVKGLIGHTESASGLASIVKVILMMHEGIIPPQASFETMNPHIHAHNSISISTKLQKWENGFKAALINNYGASGSNASIVITNPAKQPINDSAAQASTKYPFAFSAYDEKSLAAYTKKLLSYLQTKRLQGTHVSMSALSFNMFRQSNMHLRQSLFISSSSVESLIEQLGSELAIAERPRAPHVVMCFGGQVSTFVGLDRVLFDNTTVLRSHLNHCDSVCKAQGFGSIYPDIFQRSPLETTLKLQLCLFSLQYSSAKAWMDCNVRPSALVGHSFGELTAVCISGALSLEDTLRMIAGRATVIDQHWGSEKGSMLAVEAEIDQVNAILNQSKAAAHDDATVACYNSQRSFTLVGSSAAIDAVENVLTNGSAYKSIRWKRLKVTNAFHSTLVEHLKPNLLRVGDGLCFKAPSIPVEFSTEFEVEGLLDSSYVANHMRNPVYFDHAVRRLSGKYPSAAWLEIGSNSTVSAMASNALGHAKQASVEPNSPSFVAMNITSDGATTHLTTATTNLWKAGVTATFWQHHATQTTAYPTMFLPPYQFERSRHWMDLLVQPKAEPAVATALSPNSLWVFEGCKDGTPEHARFRVLTESQRYQDMVSCHKIAHTAPICPATLLVDMAIEAVTSLAPDFKSDNMQPQILYVQNMAPICIDSSRILYMDFKPGNGLEGRKEWSWTVLSNDSQGSGKPTTHVEGRIALVSTADTSYLAEFSRYERLVSHERCVSLLEDGAGENDVIQGPSIYKMFDEVVQYGHRYQGLQRLVGSSNKTESAGKVVKAYSGKTWLDACLSDCFSQVGGIWVNCMTDRDPSDMYIANGFEKWMRSPALGRESSRPDTWHVLACHERRSTNNFLTDIFIFDPRHGSLCEVILGISFAKVSRATMSKILSRLTPGMEVSRSEVPERQPAKTESHTNNEQHRDAPALGPNLGRQYDGDSVLPDLKTILANLSGLETSEIKSDAELADLGIDSLMGMELSGEINTLFKCHISTNDLSEVISVLDLVQCIQRALGVEPIIDSIASTTAPSMASGSITPSSKTSTSSDSHALDEPNGIKSKPNGLVEGGGLLNTNTILEAFAECKARTDFFIEEYGCVDYMRTIMPIQTELCIALTLEAFEDLDCNIRAAPPGHVLPVVHHIPALDGLVSYLYGMLEDAAGLIKFKDGQIRRTATKAPTTPSADVLKRLVRDFPQHSYPHNLTHLAGSRLSDVLSGKSDGIKVIFGSEKGKQLATGLYTDSPLNKLSYMQMRDFLWRLVAKLPRDGTPLRILELGAGTGGTTTWIVPLLEEMGVSVEYTFSDLSPSFVATARKRFAKEYSFMKFGVIDVEKTPSNDLLASQDLILASNAIHATHSLARSVSSIHKMLRPGGFLMMLEMTRTVYWVDMIFGLLEGWWLFEDGRTHAIAHQSRWERDLLDVGFSTVDWTDGNHPESSIQRIIIACKAETNIENADAGSAAETRQGMVDAYVRQYTQGFVALDKSPNHHLAAADQIVLVTGATGSLGSHLVSYLSGLATVKEVICFNRRSKTDAQERQMDALESRGINGADTGRFVVIETDSSKPLLGLDEEQYAAVAGRVTHIIHSAWPMSGKRPLKGFETQFRVMRNLIDLANAASSAQNRKIGFQLVSSIAVVGHFPLQTGTPLVPEERMQSTDSVLPNGYGDAKWTCELMLDSTLHRYPGHFRAMSVRLGQIAGSRASGYWNHMEHFTFMLQSSQTLKAFPKLEGTMSWTPVDDVASSLGELLLLEPTTFRYPIYHIENPVGQPWVETVPILAETIGAEQVPFDEWVKKVRLYKGPEASNPAAKLVDFFDYDYIRMSCGGLLLDTSKARQHCKTLPQVGAISPELLRRFVDAWKSAGILQ